jgi:methylaspartate mutase epsilon subunit
MSNIDLSIGFDEQRIKLRESSYLSELSASASSDFLADLPDDRFASIAYHNRGFRPFLQPRGGFTLWSHQRELTLALYAAGADFIPLTIDSHTRQNDHERAAMLLRQSEETGENLLNGYPLLGHGAIATRALFEDVELPISLRHGTPDARVLVEAALDSGITEIEGGGLCYCLPYSRAYPIDRALLNWQYVDRLCATLSRGERLIHRESFGALTATMVPPFMAVAIEVLELLLAVGQGVRSFAVSFSQSGSITQDLATASALRKVAAKVLAEQGYQNIYVRLVFHQWMGAFPSERVQADGLIVQGSIIGALCQADKIVVKTRSEALGVPDPRANSDAVAMSRYAIDLCKGSKLDGDDVFEEAEAIECASLGLINAVINQQSTITPLWERVARAVRTGLIDVPFSPHQDNMNRLWTLRDPARGIRVADPGLVPLPASFLRREERLLATRARDSSIDRMIGDIQLMLSGSK